MNIQTPDIQQNRSSLHSRIAITITLVAIIVAALTSVVVYVGVRQNLEDQFQKRVLNIASLAALSQQGDLHSTLKISSGAGSSTYFQISQQNSAIVKSDPIIGSVYTMRQNEQGNIYFVLATQQNNLSEKGKPTPGLGQVYTDASPVLKKEFATLNAPIAETNQRSDQWGNWLSAYAPFYRSDGTREGIVGVDVNKDSLLIAENNILLTAFGIFALLAPILAIAGWILGMRITRPILQLAKTALSISVGNFNQRIPDSENDSNEVSQLGQAINRMAAKINASSSEMEIYLSEHTIRLQRQTKELEEVKKRTGKQENQIKALALVARSITSIQNLDNLLPRIAAILSEQLSFYHIGIFLLDEAKEYAIFTATNSVGGQKMLERNHRLKVGAEGMVGYTAGTARFRIAVDTDKDMVFLTNPDLPETQSELALPLKIGRDVIGVLDIQSTYLSAFAEEDVELFSILADYVSIAIQNVRRFQETQKTITESDTLYRTYLRQEWKSFTNQGRNLGYIYNISGSKPIIKRLEYAKVEPAIHSGHPTISQEKAQSRLSVPIKLRGQVIGVLNIQSGSGHSWEDDEIDIATAVADRVGLAVENARLLEDSQSRAARERTIGEITSKIGASINIRNVLQTAVEELGHILPGSDVIIQLKDIKDKE